MGYDKEHMGGFLNTVGTLMDEMLDLLTPFAGWFKRHWASLVGLVWLVSFLWKTIIHAFADSLQAWEAISVAFMEMVIVSVRVLGIVIAGFILWWIGSSLLITVLRRRTRNVPESLTQEDVMEDDSPIDNSVETEQDQSYGVEIDQTAEMLPVQPHPLRQYMNDSFCGPDDAVFNKLVSDIDRITASRTINLEHSLIGLATLLYTPNSGPHIKLTEDACKIRYTKWVRLFFECVGVPLTIKDIRPSRFEDFESPNGVPMKYLYAKDWDLFYDQFQLKKFLADK